MMVGQPAPKLAMKNVDGNSTKRPSSCHSTGAAGTQLYDAATAKTIT